MRIVVDGIKIANAILDDLRLRARDSVSKPKLAVFLAAENRAETSFVKIKQKKAAEIGVEVEVRKFFSDAKPSDLISQIGALNSDPSFSGIIVQLPLPAGFSKDKILNSIDPKKDVDCLTDVNKTKISKEEHVLFEPPAAAAILEILAYHHIDLSKGNIVIVGSGDLVGKPLSAMLLRRGVNFKLANRHTENLSELLQQADIIITGVGKKNLITGDMVKNGVVVIDAGTVVSEGGKITGDVDWASVAPKAKLVSPVPGGVGPVTVAKLLSNVVRAAALGRKI